VKAYHHPLILKLFLFALLTIDVKSFFANYRSIAVIAEFSVDEGDVSLLKRSYVRVLNSTRYAKEYGVPCSRL
jgi:hypothetical protein